MKDKKIPMFENIKHYCGYFMLICFLSCSGKSEHQSNSVEAMSIVSKIELKDLNNRPINLSDYRGKTVFINFWATWCRPCIEEMPSIERAKDILNGKNIEFFIASNEETKRIQKFMERSKLSLNYARVENMEALNIQALPTTYIINTSGELVFSETGFRTWDDAVNIEMITEIIGSHE